MKNLDYSKEHNDYLKKIKKKKNLVIIFQVSILILFIGLWELLASTKVIDSFFVSSPSRMIKTFVNLFTEGELFKHIGITLYEALISFLLACGIGLVVAILLWWSDFVRKVLDPYLVILNSLPKIALGPLIIIWCGVGTKPIVVMAILISIIVTILSALAAFLNCEKSKILLMQSMGATKLQIFTKLILPNALPELISILKINVGLTWVGTIMGEYLVSKAGLGYLIVYGGTIFQLDLVMTSTVILCILAGLMYFGVTPLYMGLQRNFLTVIPICIPTELRNSPKLRTKKDCL